MAQAVERDDDDESVDIPDPDDDDGYQVNDMANFYLFVAWWEAGQNPISLTELRSMPDGMWLDFKYFLSKYSNLRKVVKAQKNFGKPKSTGEMFRG